MILLYNIVQPFQWWFSKQVMVSGFKISSKSDKLLESFTIKYKEEYLNPRRQRFYAPLEPSDNFVSIAKQLKNSIPVF